MQTWVDASYAIHTDIKSHIGGVMPYLWAEELLWANPPSIIVKHNPVCFINDVYAVYPPGLAEHNLECFILSMNGMKFYYLCHSLCVCSCEAQLCVLYPPHSLCMLDLRGVAKHNPVCFINHLFAICSEPPSTHVMLYPLMTQQKL